MTLANRRPPSTLAADELVVALRRFNQETEHYIDQVSRQHSVHRTDLDAIGLVMQRGTASPKDISEGLSLSPSATSAMLDRLERSGHMQRGRVEGDRRAVRVEITDTARAVGASMFSLLAIHMYEVLEGYGDDELSRMTELLELLSTAARAASDEVDGKSGQ